MSFTNRKISKNLRADIMRSQIIDRASFEPNAVSIIYSRGELEQYFDSNKTEYTVEVLNAYSKTENTVLTKNSNSLTFEKIRYFEGNVGYNFSFIEGVAAYNYSEITFGHNVFTYMLDNREKADALNLLSKDQITNLKSNAELRDIEDSLAYINATKKAIGDKKTPICIKNGIVQEGGPIGLNKYLMEFRGYFDLINGENVYLKCFVETTHKKTEEGDIFDGDKTKVLDFLINSLPFKCNCLCARYDRVFLGEIANLSYDVNANKISLTLNYQIQEDDKVYESSEITWGMFHPNFSMNNGTDQYGEQKVYSQTMEIDYTYDFKYHII